mgnify:CR=1
MNEELRNDINALQHSIFLLVDTFEKKHNVVVPTVELYQDSTVVTLRLPVEE